jgi:hypothetical protein
MTFASTDIGRLDDQQQSRAIRIEMKRRKPGETIKWPENGVSEVLQTIERKFARWAQT